MKNTRNICLSQRLVILQNSQEKHPQKESQDKKDRELRCSYTSPQLVELITEFIWMPSQPSGQNLVSNLKNDTHKERVWNIKEKIYVTFGARGQVILCKLWDNSIQMVWQSWCIIPANFFWLKAVRFLFWKFWDIQWGHNYIQRFLKTYKATQRFPKMFQTIQKFSRKWLPTISALYVSFKNQRFWETTVIFSVYTPDFSLFMLVWVYILLESVSVMAVNSSHFPMRCELVREWIFNLQAWDLAGTVLPSKHLAMWGAWHGVLVQSTHSPQYSVKSIHWRMLQKCAKPGHK